MIGRIALFGASALGFLAVGEGSAQDLDPFAVDTHMPPEVRLVPLVDPLTEEVRLQPASFGLVQLLAGSSNQRLFNGRLERGAGAFFGARADAYLSRAHASLSANVLRRARGRRTPRLSARLGLYDAPRVDDDGWHSQFLISGGVGLARVEPGRVVNEGRYERTWERSIHLSWDGRIAERVGDAGRAAVVVEWSERATMSWATLSWTQVFPVRRLTRGAFADTRFSITTSLAWSKGNRPPDVSELFAGAGTIVQLPAYRLLDTLGDLQVSYSFYVVNLRELNHPDVPVSVRSPDIPRTLHEVAVFVSASVFEVIPGWPG